MESNHIEKRWKGCRKKYCALKQNRLQALTPFLVGVNQRAVRKLIDLATRVCWYRLTFNCRSDTWLTEPSTRLGIPTQIWFNFVMRRAEYLAKNFSCSFSQFQIGSSLLAHRQKAGTSIYHSPGNHYITKFSCLKVSSQLSLLR